MPAFKVTATAILTATDFLTFESEDVAIAKPVKFKSEGEPNPFDDALSFVVQGVKPGLTRITGTLDLGDFGKADDEVFTWVFMPEIETVQIEPTPLPGSACVAPIMSAPIVIDSGSPFGIPDPGPSVRTFVQWVLGSTTVTLKGRAKTAVGLLDRFLPRGLASWNTALNKDLCVGQPDPSAPQNVRLHFEGRVTFDTSGCTQSGEDVTCSVTLSTLKLGSHLPNPAFPWAFPSNLISSVVRNTYTTRDGTIAVVGQKSDPFDIHIVHRGKVGETVADVDAGFSSFLLGSGKNTQESSLLATGRSSPRRLPAARLSFGSGRRSASRLQSRILPIHRLPASSSLTSSSSRRLARRQRHWSTPRPFRSERWRRMRSRGCRRPPHDADRPRSGEERDQRSRCGIGRSDRFGSRRAGLIQESSRRQHGRLCRYAVGFEITVTNPFDEPLENITLTDRQFFTPSGGPETLVDTSTFPTIPILGPHQTVGFSLQLQTTPTQAGIVRNVVSATDAMPATATILIQNPPVLTKVVGGGVSSVFPETPIGFRRSPSRTRMTTRSTSRSRTNCSSARSPAVLRCFVRRPPSRSARCRCPATKRAPPPSRSGRR